MPPATFDSLLNGPLCTDKERESVLSAALTLATLANLGAARPHISTWASTLAPRVTERWRDTLAQLGPTEDSFRAALAGKPSAYEAQLRTVRTRAEELRVGAEEADVEGQQGLTQASKTAHALLRQRAKPPEEKGSVLARALAPVVALLSEPAPDLAPDLTTLPEDLRREVRDVADRHLRAEVLLACAERLDALADEAQKRRDQHQQGIDTLTRVRTRLRDETAERLAGFPARDGVARYDLELDGEEAIERLLQKARPLPLDGLVRDGRLDEGAAEEALCLATADELKRLVQRPLHALLPELFGARSLRDPLDAFVRNCAPLAGFDRRELEDRDVYDGVTIAVVEARDPVLRRQLLDALERVGDVAVLEASPDRLPSDLAARIVRYAGLLPTETIVGTIFDLMMAAASPTEIGRGAARDWIDEDLPEVVSQERLVEEIERRKRRRESTRELEAWLEAEDPRAMAAK